MKFDNDDFQLNIIENYLIKLQHCKDCKFKNFNDFGILMQKTYIRQSKQIQLLKNSGDSFIGGKKLRGDSPSSNQFALDQNLSFSSDSKNMVGSQSQSQKQIESFVVSQSCDDQSDQFGGE